ncbi:oligopeptide transport system ATP-binding protein [Rhizobiales bacterium GAS188]|nr:oligopeptide transport system ATP-binding protein [Rhizobiales bacterium GAS188]
MKAPHVEVKDLLDVRGLSVTFTTEEGKITAVDDLSFKVGRGETLVIVGESGSGKSAASLAVMGLIDAPGKVTCEAIDFIDKGGRKRDLSRLREAEMQRIRGAEIAMIFQEPMTSLNPVYTVGDQIIEAIRFHEAMTRRAASARAEEMLALLGVPDPRRRLDAYPHQLSGGMRQRAMIGMALACRPSLLIADEPTTALDVTVQAQILELIRSLQRELGMAVVFITHNLGVAAEIADRIMVMYAGQAVESGPCRAIFRATHLPYTIGLMRSVPRLGLDRGGGPLPAIPGNMPDPRRLPRGCRFHPRCSFVEPGLCDMQAPPLESCGDGHEVRCLRWRKVTA